MINTRHVYGFKKKLFYLNFNIHSYQFFQCSCNIPIMHWETLETQFPNQIETIFFLNNIIFYHMFMLFFLLLNNDFSFHLHQQDLHQDI